MMERYACSMFALLLALASVAQQRVVEMSCDPCPSAKLVQEVMTDYDAQARATGDALRLKVLLDTNIPLDQVVDHLNESLHCRAQVIQTMVKAQGAASAGAAPPLPERVDTGDPAADDAAHEAAKQAWRLANPDAHRALMQAQGRTIPQQP
jgi:hypothetical protein